MNWLSRILAQIQTPCCGDIPIHTGGEDSDMRTCGLCGKSYSLAYTPMNWRTIIHFIPAYIQRRRYPVRLKVGKPPVIDMADKCSCGNPLPSDCGTIRLCARCYDGILGIVGDGQQIDSERDRVSGDAEYKQRKREGVGG